jgi:uncharacterized PurR-regulated membrane protein YhhQ (DUF165 family)
MNESVGQRTSRFLYLSAGIVTFLILLINVSFKIIILQGLVFVASALLCPIIAGLYLLALRNCTFNEQRHLLNISLITLYIFCVGVFILVNLPAAEYMQDNSVYQIIFEDIPKKFFATTIAFALSFYLPHLLFCSKKLVLSPKYCVFLALSGGIGFFCIDFFLLFSGLLTHRFKHIFIDSLMITSLLLLVIGISYLSFLLDEQRCKNSQSTPNEEQSSFPLFQYLLCLAVAVMLMCIACEYRIVSLNKENILAASCIFFPAAMIISTLVAEMWDFYASLKLVFVVVAAQFIFDIFLMGLVALPSPHFFNLNPYYNYLIPRRLLAASLSLFICLMVNAMLVHYLKEYKWKLRRPLRIFVANCCANSMLCLVDYSLLFGGIYPYDQIMNLVVNVWQYKLIMTFMSLPLILWLCKNLHKNNTLIFQNTQ